MTKPQLVYTYRDWTEDAPLENGNYYNRCCQCQQHFVGHKRRVICKTCSAQAKREWDALTPEQQTAQMEANVQRMAEFFRNR